MCERRSDSLKAASVEVEICGMSEKYRVVSPDHPAGTDRVSEHLEGRHPLFERPKRRLERSRIRCQRVLEVVTVTLAHTAERVRPSRVPSCAMFASMTGLRMAKKFIAVLSTSPCEAYVSRSSAHGVGGPARYSNGDRRDMYVLLAPRQSCRALTSACPGRWARGTGRATGPRCAAIGVSSGTSRVDVACGRTWAQPLRSERMEGELLECKQNARSGR